MSKKVELEWSYTPKNFIEINHELDFKGVNVKFNDGKVSITTDEKIFTDDPHFVTDAEQVIKNFLNGVSIQSHSSFELSRKPTKYYNEDGSLQKEVTTGGSTSIVIISGISGHADFKIIDKHGNVKRDSIKERIDDKKLWGLLISNVDSKNQKLVNSYLKAIDDKKK